MTIESSISPAGGGDEDDQQLEQQEDDGGDGTQPRQQNITIGSIVTFVEENPGGVLIVLAVLLLAVAWFWG